MKKTISIIAAAAMICATSSAFAADTKNGNPDVFINGAKLSFADQEAVIVDGRTLVPARGVFEAMGADVSWDGDIQQVQVKSADDNTWVRLIIGDADMKVYDMSGFYSTLSSGQNFVAPETVVTLDVAPQIISDRTMIPLRAISEAMGADVQWDGDAYAVNITSKDAVVNEKADGKPAFYLNASSDTVAEGETVDLYITAENIPEGTYVSSVTAGIEYDPEAFEYVDAMLVNGEDKISPAVQADNPEFAYGLLKVLYVTIDPEAAVKEDGNVMKITFKSINGSQGEFKLSTGYHTELTYNTMLGVYDEAADKDLEYSGNKLYIDTTPVTVNAAE